MFLLRLFALAMFFLCACRAHAGASLFVDDAATTPDGRCQIESWVRVHAPGRELTAVPACTVAGTELGLGVSHHLQPRSGPVWNVGAKHLFRDFESKAWGIGAALGGTFDADAERWTAWSVNLPVSIALDAVSDIASLDLLVGHQDGLDAGPWLTVGINTLLSR